MAIHVISSRGHSLELRQVRLEGLHCGVRTREFARTGASDGKTGWRVSASVERQRLEVREFQRIAAVLRKNEASLALVET